MEGDDRGLSAGEISAEVVGVDLVVSVRGCRRTTGGVGRAVVDMILVG